MLSVNFVIKNISPNAIAIIPTTYENYSNIFKTIRDMEIDSMEKVIYWLTNLM